MKLIAVFRWSHDHRVRLAHERTPAQPKIPGLPTLDDVIGNHQPRSCIRSLTRWTAELERWRTSSRMSALSDQNAGAVHDYGRLMPLTSHDRGLPTAVPIHLPCELRGQERQCDAGRRLREAAPGRSSANEQQSNCKSNAKMRAMLQQGMGVS
jgi:hypothetical protein